MQIIFIIKIHKIINLFRFKKVRQVTKKLAGNFFCNLEKEIT